MTFSELPCGCEIAVYDSKINTQEEIDEVMKKISKQCKQGIKCELYKDDLRSRNACK